MAKSKNSKRYTREFRRELVALHRACLPDQTYHAVLPVKDERAERARRLSAVVDP